MSLQLDECERQILWVEEVFSGKMSRVPVCGDAWERSAAVDGHVYEGHVKVLHVDIECRRGEKDKRSTEVERIVLRRFLNPRESVFPYRIAD